MATKDKVISSTLSSKGDATATIRPSHIDLNRRIMTAEIGKKKKLKGPCNPVTMDDVEDVAEPKNQKNNDYYWSDHGTGHGLIYGPGQLLILQKTLISL